LLMRLGTKAQFTHYYFVRSRLSDRLFLIVRLIKYKMSACCLNARGRLLFEMLVAQLVVKFTAFCVTQRFVLRLYVNTTAGWRPCQVDPSHSFPPSFLKPILTFIFHLCCSVDRDSAVGIATPYGLEGPGIEFRWGRNFPHPSRPTLRPIQPPIQWVPGLSRGLKRPGRGLTTHPHLAPRLKKE
jgi:hypothetical protein